MCFVMSKHASKNAEFWVKSFTLAYLALASIFSWRTGNWEFVLYVFVVLVLALFVMNIHQRIRFSTGILWMLSLWGLLHMLGGLLPVPAWLPLGGEKAVLYNLWLIPEIYKYDHLVHMFGFGVTTWVCWQVLQPIVSGNREHASEIILSVLAANGLGAFNEIIEFFAVLWIPNTNVGGYINTGWDLVANLAGSLIAAVVIWYGKPITKQLK